MKRPSTLFLTVLILLGTACCGPKTAPETVPVHPEWSYGAVMYELNTRQFTPEGTFAAAQRELPRLKSLGVDIVWFMPIHPIGIVERKGELGSYYSISDYGAVNPEFGNIDDFKNFVAGAHDLGMKVIMDWVPNHTSRDALWLAAHPEWYVMGKDGTPVTQYDWTDIAQLDYSNADMRRAMTDAMLDWVRKADVDGFRCDYAVGPPLDFWKSTIEELKAVKSDLFMLAEAENSQLHTVAGFDASYAWELHHLMNGIAQGTSPIDSLRSYLERSKVQYPAEAIRLTFTSNHDENSWNGTEFERMGDGAEAFAALSYLLPGMPLIYNGQEVGLDRRLEFFKKDPIDWGDRGAFGELYYRLNELKHDNPALAAGECGGMLNELATDKPSQVYAFERRTEEECVTAVFNLSPEPVSVKLTGSGEEFELKAWQYVINE